MSPHPKSSPTPIARFLAPLLFLLPLLAYLPSLANEFIWDDDTLITSNPAVTNPSALQGLSDIWSGKDSPDFFPLTSTSFWMEYRLWGARPAGFHLVNVLLHAVSTLLFWKLLTRLPLPAPRIAAWFAAALFAVHPANVESVAWIAERKNTLSMVFFLLALLAWLSFRDATEARRRRNFYALTFAAFIAALLAKTTTVMLPFVLLLMQWWQHKRLTRKDLLLSAPFFGAALLLGLLTIHFQSAQGLNPDTLARPWDLRIAQSGYNLWFYLYKTVLPLDLATVYPEARLAHVAGISFLPLALWILLLGTLFRLRHFDSAHHAFTALAFFTINLAPVLGVMNMAWTAVSVVGDHFLYIPMLGILPFATAGIARLTNVHKATGMLARTASAAGILVLAILAALTFRHTATYKNMLTLWAYNTTVRPAAGYAYYQYGLAYKLADRPDDAAAQFKRAIDLSPRIVSAHLELGQYYFARKEYRQALDQFLSVMALVNNKHRDAFLLLAESAWRSGDFEYASHLYEDALRSHTDDPAIPYGYGLMLQTQGKLEPALSQYKSAAAMDPAFTLAHHGAGTCLLALNRPQEAADELKTAVQQAPAYAAAWLNLSQALRALNQTAEADKALNTAVSLDPSLTPGTLPAASHPATQAEPERAAVPATTREK